LTPSWQAAAAGAAVAENATQQRSIVTRTGSERLLVVVRFQAVRVEQSDTPVTPEQAMVRGDRRSGRRLFSW